MTKSLLTELERYEKRVKSLDQKAENLAEEKKNRYMKARSQFMSRLKVWRQSVESDISLLRRNIEEGYYELESKLL